MKSLLKLLHFTVSISNARLIDLSSNLHKHDILNMTLHQEKDAVTIAIVGDSITAGQDKEMLGEPWPTLLNSYFE